jgi:NADH:ubiquinone oxidoreductase subunit 4 (subunit M)
LLDLRPREWGIAVALSAMIFWIGLYPAPFLNRINASIQKLTERLEQGSELRVGAKSPLSLTLPLKVGGKGGTEVQR